MIPGTYCLADRTCQRCPIYAAIQYWASQGTFWQSLWPWRQSNSPGTLSLTAPATMVSPATTTTTITAGSIPSGVFTECALAALSNRLGQQGKERAKDRYHIEELFQQLTETSDQLAYIRKVLEHLISGQTPAPTATVVTSASSTVSRPAPSSGSSCLPPEQTTSLPGIGIPPVSHASLFIAQSSTASGSVNPSISSNHIRGHAASATHTGFLQASWDFPNHALTLAFQGHSNDASITHSPQPVFSSDLLPWFSLGMGTPALGQPLSLSFHQQQLTQAAIATGLPVAPQHSATYNNTLYHRAGLTNLPVPGTLPLYSVQTTTSTPSIATDIATMAKVIPNVWLKLQQKIIQGEFIDLSELLQADFQFKYASIEAKNAFELVHNDETVIIWPIWKGKQIDSLGTWLSTLGLYEQVVVYVYPWKYSQVAYYRNFNWSAVQMYDITFQAMCTHHGCPFTPTDQVLMANHPRCSSSQDLNLQMLQMWWL